VVSADYARLAFDFEFFDESGAPIPVHELELFAERDSDVTLQIELQRMGETIWLGIQEPSGSISSLATEVIVVRRSTGEVVELHDLFEEETPTILFTDGTSVVASTLTEAQVHHRPVDPAVLVQGSWNGVSVTTEIGRSSEGIPGVQEALASQLADRCQLVLTDHGSRELADLIALTIAPDASVRLELVHCKAAHAGGPRRRLEDIGEVLDQAARSARWADPASQLWAELLARLDRRAGCVFLHDPRGDGHARLQSLVDRPPAIEATIYAAQPGLDLSQVQGWEAGEALINLTVAWCRLVGGADFRVLGA
jgi:hypothetical protein